MGAHQVQATHSFIKQTPIAVQYATYSELVNLAKEKIGKDISTAWHCLHQALDTLQHHQHGKHTQKEEQGRNHIQHQLQGVQGVENNVDLSLKNIVTDTTVQDAQRISDHETKTLMDLFILQAKCTKQSKNKETLSQQIILDNNNHLQRGKKNILLDPLRPKQKKSLIVTNNQIQQQLQRKFVQKKIFQQIKNKKDLKIKLFPLSLDHTPKRKIYSEEEAINKLRANIEFIEGLRKRETKQKKCLNEWKNDGLLIQIQSIRNNVKISSPKQIIISSSHESQRHYIIESNTRLPSIKNTSHFPKNRIPYNLYNIQMRANEFYKMK